MQWMEFIFFERESLYIVFKNIFVKAIYQEKYVSWSKICLDFIPFDLGLQPDMTGGMVYKSLDDHATSKIEILSHRK